MGADRPRTPAPISALRMIVGLGARERDPVTTPIPGLPTVTPTKA
jgi:hypothetical protein